jgi:hypothetical protein
MNILPFFLSFVTATDSTLPNFDQLLSRVSSRDSKTGAIEFVWRRKKNIDPFDTDCVGFSDYMELKISKISNDSFIVETDLISDGTVGGIYPGIAMKCRGQSFRFPQSAKLEEEYRRQCDFRKNADKAEIEKQNRIKKLTYKKLHKYSDFCAALDSLGRDCDEMVGSYWNPKDGTKIEIIILKYPFCFLLFHIQPLCTILFDAQESYNSFGFDSTNSMFGPFVKPKVDRHCK